MNFNLSSNLITRGFSSQVLEYSSVGNQIILTTFFHEKSNLKLIETGYMVHNYFEEFIDDISFHGLEPLFALNKINQFVSHCFERDKRSDLLDFVKDGTLSYLGKYIIHEEIEAFSTVPLELTYENKLNRLFENGIGIKLNLLNSSSLKDFRLKYITENGDYIRFDFVLVIQFLVSMSSLYIF